MTQDPLDLQDSSSIAFLSGNCLELTDGRLGLIDFGQTRRLSDKERLALSRVVVAVGTDADPIAIASSMQQAGFCAQNNEDYEMWTKYATLFFDSDLESQRLGFATPQLYFSSLMQKNPLIEIPDAFSKWNDVFVPFRKLWFSMCCKEYVSSTFLCTQVFVARVSFLFRGMGTGIGIGPVQTSKYWLPEAEAVLRRMKASNQGNVETQWENQWIVIYELFLIVGRWNTGTFNSVKRGVS